MNEEEHKGKLRVTFWFFLRRAEARSLKKFFFFLLEKVSCHACEGKKSHQNLFKTHSRSFVKTLL